MKRIISLLIAAAALLSAPSAMAYDLSSILGGLKGAGSQATDSTSTTTGSGDAGGKLGDVLGGVAAALGIGSDQADISKLAGEWAYDGPAVTFKSDNLLLKAGGAAAATTVEKKLEPYYQKAGLENRVVTINADSTFTFKTSHMSLSGTIERQPDSGNYAFHFQALKKIPVGTMPAYIKLTGTSRMALTFDVSKLIKIIEMAGSLTGSSSIKTVSTMLNQYDGLTAGFDLKRTK